MFVMYGDTFLPNPGSYDELYYELLRQHGVFDSLNETGLKYLEKGNYLATCALLSMINLNFLKVKPILNH